MKAREMENFILNPKVINPANKGKRNGEFNSQSKSHQSGQ
jgi:hypothetical protein